MLLITTNNWKTTKYNDEILFLGKWCIKDKELKSLKTNFKIVPHHWNDKDLTLKDAELIRKKYEYLLEDLTGKLNMIHNINWTNRQWRILIGPWLHKFLEIALDRWNSIETAETCFNISNTFIYENIEKDLYTSSYTDLSNKCRENYWNYIFYNLLIKFKDTIPYKTIPNDSQKKESKSIFISYFNLEIINKKLKAFIKFKLITKLFRFLKKYDDIALVEHYMSMNEFSKIKLNFQNLPLFEFTKNTLNFGTKQNQEIRNKLTFKNDHSKTFLNFCQKLIPNIFPTIYLEDFKNLRDLAYKSALPKEPKFIITAISQWHDEVFKLWTAFNISKKSKLYIIQHGGSYGANLFNFFEEHEIKISDKFFVWGWSDQEENLSNIPINIIRKSDYGKWDKNGTFLITTNHLSKGYVSQMHPASHNADKSIEYSKLITLLISTLISRVNTKVKLRPYPGEDNIPKKIKTLSKQKKILISKEKLIKNEYYQSKLVICAYYFSSTFLECMALNIPCILMLDENFDPFRENINGLMENLCKTNICHKSIDSLCDHLVYVEGNIEYWWESKEVINAKKEFCNYFANNNCSVSDAILRFIKENNY